LDGKQLRGISGEKAIKVLWIQIRTFVKAGGQKKKGKGSHVNIKMPGGQLITIPIHGELKIGLLKAAIKKAGLSEEEFSKYL
jgi:predicted RNA binding protein YcfA (HicA-like mRNA interferase family)